MGSKYGPVQLKWQKKLYPKVHISRCGSTNLWVSVVSSEQTFGTKHIYANVVNYNVLIEKILKWNCLSLSKP